MPHIFALIFKPLYIYSKHMVLLYLLFVKHCETIINQLIPCTEFKEVYEELENLRRLVQKYRLELSNREGNFNRMFTEKTPIHLDSRNRNSLMPAQSKSSSRDKSFSYAMSQTYGASTDAVDPVGIRRPAYNLIFIFFTLLTGHGDLHFLFSTFFKNAIFLCNRYGNF